MRPRLRAVAGTLFVGIGVLSVAASVFLASWDYAAAGERDIAARGGPLLFIVLPWIIALRWLLVTILTVQPLRRAGTGWWSVVALTLVSVLAAAVIQFLPPFFFSRALTWLPDPLRPGADFAIARAFTIGGLALVWGKGRPRGHLTYVEADERLRS